MIRVIVESPFWAPSEEERATRRGYLRACMRDCILRGETPYASHGLLTQPGVLDDSVPAERELGIRAGFEWRAAAAKTVVYTDLGISAGMQAGIDHANETRHPIEFRTILGRFL